MVKIPKRVLFRTPQEATYSSNRTPTHPSALYTSTSIDTTVAPTYTRSSCWRRKLLGNCPASPLLIAHTVIQHPEGQKSSRRRIVVLGRLTIRCGLANLTREPRQPSATRYQSSGSKCSNLLHLSCSDDCRRISPERAALTALGRCQEWRREH